jgi:glycine/D-amino acid oxidase-like deaminating enzyme
VTTHPAGSDESLSLWIDTTPSTNYPPLRGDLEADVAIVGAGITGITAAYLLAKAGQSVVLVDKGRIAMSETGHTTRRDDGRRLSRDDQGAWPGRGAHRHGGHPVGGRAHPLAGQRAGHRLRLQGRGRLLYAEEEKDREYLQRQHEDLLRAGMKSEWVDRVPLPFPTVGGLRYPNQYVFHVRRYLLPIAEAAVQKGARIFENTLVDDVQNAEQDGRCLVKSEAGSIRARHVLLATHVPLNDRGTLWAKMHVTRTYVAAAPIQPGQVTDALFWDTPYPYHYTRLLETEKGLFLIVGGEDRDVGKEGNHEERYEALEEYCRSHFGVTAFTHRWSGQINEPADMLPFIGESSHGKNVWMSTGYSGTGMTYGTLSGMLLADFALEREAHCVDQQIRFPRCGL